MRDIRTRRRYAHETPDERANAWRAMVDEQADAGAMAPFVDGISDCSTGCRPEPTAARQIEHWSLWTASSKRSAAAGGREAASEPWCLAMFAQSARR